MEVLVSWCPGDQVRTSTHFWQNRLRAPSAVVTSEARMWAIHSLRGTSGVSVRHHCSAVLSGRVSVGQ